MTCAAAQVRQTFWPGGLDKGSMAAVIFRLRGRTRGGVWRDVVRRGRLDAHEGPCMHRRENLWWDGRMQRNSWDLIRCTVFRRVCEKRMAWPDDISEVPRVMVLSCFYWHVAVACDIHESPWPRQLLPTFQSSSAYFGTWKSIRTTKKDIILILFVWCVYINKTKIKREENCIFKCLYTIQKNMKGKITFETLTSKM